MRGRLPPVLLHLTLYGSRTSRSGSVVRAFAKWNRQQSVSLPSNWTPADNKRFAAANRPLRPTLYYRFENAVGSPFPFDVYHPLRSAERIDNCPADLMNPVADLLAPGFADKEERRLQYEAKP